MWSQIKRDLDLGPRGTEEDTHGKLMKGKILIFVSETKIKSSIYERRFLPFMNPT